MPDSKLTEVNMPGETSKQRKRREELDRRLDRELEGTFPASDPLKITSPRAGISDMSDQVEKPTGGDLNKSDK